MQRKTINSKPTFLIRTALVTPLAALLLAGVGCTGGPRIPTGDFDIKVRAAQPQDTYAVFYLPEPDDLDPQASDKEREDNQMLKVARDSIARELLERGKQSTTDVSDHDIDAYMTYGYRVSGRSGTNRSYIPGSSYTVNGRYFSIPGQWTSNNYAYDDQQLWVKIYDWSELIEAGGQTGRILPIWEGTLDYRAQGMNGLQQSEAEYMAMNLLADFPTPRVAGAHERQLFPVDQRLAAIAHMRDPETGVDSTQPTSPETTTLVSDR